MTPILVPIASPLLTFTDKYYNHNSNFHTWANTHFVHENVDGKSIFEI